MPWCLDITEYERGWGSRLDETIVFGGDQKDLDAAKQYAKEYNAQNTAPSAPDWYMQAGNPYFVEKAPVGSKVTKFKRPRSSVRNRVSVS